MGRRLARRCWPRQFVARLRNSMTSTAAFDGLAPAYDARFTHTALGGFMRRAVWRWLDRAFDPGDRVLELNCGTGEDGVHLAGRGVRVVGTDGSAAMVDIARAKAQDAGVGDTLLVRQLEIEQLEDLAVESGGGGGWDGAFSSFGGLNCVADLPQVARALGALLKREARLVLCVMGPLVPWEWAWFVAHGQVGRALRRLARGGVRWRGATVRYPSIRTMR